jgi:16S rRNA (guanine966-N2)-methyltransferase
LRIISGKYRGRLIRPPRGLPVRPTTDLAKESLFNILNNRIDFEGLIVLDLFSGTGNIALEFASRDAAHVVAVESNYRCAEFIQKKANVFSYLKSVRRTFDVVFADPPYDLKDAENVPGLVLENGLLAEEGWLVMEHDAEVSFRNHANFVEERQYGKVHFSFFQRQPAAKE